MHAPSVGTQCGAGGVSGPLWGPRLRVWTGFTAVVWDACGAWADGEVALSGLRKRKGPGACVLHLTGEAIGEG